MLAWGGHCDGRPSRKGEEPSALAIGPPVRPRYKLCPALLCALRKAAKHYRDASCSCSKALFHSCSAEPGWLHGLRCYHTLVPEPHRICHPLLQTPDSITNGYTCSVRQLETARGAAGTCVSHTHTSSDTTQLQSIIQHFKYQYHEHRNT